MQQNISHFSSGKLAEMNMSMSTSYNNVHTLLISDTYIMHSRMSRPLVLTLEGAGLHVYTMPSI